MTHYDREVLGMRDEVSIICRCTTKPYFARLWTNKRRKSFYWNTTCNTKNIIVTINVLAPQEARISSMIFIYLSHNIPVSASDIFIAWWYSATDYNMTLWILVRNYGICPWRRGVSNYNPGDKQSHGSRWRQRVSRRVDASIGPVHYDYVK